MTSTTTSTPSTDADAGTTVVELARLRELPLARLTVAAGFNPRQQIARDRDYAALVATVRERGSCSRSACARPAPATTS